MKVGIVTFHRAHNCGAALQCVALQTVIRELGHEVFVLDGNRVGDGFWFCVDCTSVRGFLSALRSQVRRLVDIRRYRYWLFMRRFMNLLPGQLHGEGVKLDCVVVGSDQVLSPTLTGKWLCEFLLEGAPDGLKKILYAGSFGLTTLPLDVRDRYAKALSRFSRLSVREGSGVVICTKELGLREPVEWVLDPTLLLEARFYKSWESPVRVRGDFILVYTVGAALKSVESVSSFVADRLGMKVVFATLIFSRMKQGWTAVSPGQLLWLMRRARCVIAGSFHGTALAIVNRKPFVSVLPKAASSNARVEELLENLGLSKQIVYGAEELTNPAVDKLLSMSYDKASSLLAGLREHSVDYLRRALNE